MDTFLDAIDDGVGYVYRSVVPPGPKDRLRSAQSELRRVSQQVSSESNRSVNIETRLTARMKKEARRNEMSAAKETALAIARGQANRAYLNRLANRLNALKSRMDMATTNESISSILKHATSAMTAISAALGGSNMRRSLASFERQNTAIGDMADAVGDTLDECDDEAELDGKHLSVRADELMAQVMDEIAIEHSIPTAPTGILPSVQCQERPAVPAPATRANHP